MTKGYKLNEHWTSRIDEEIKTAILKKNKPNIDHTTTNIMAIRYIILALSKQSIPYHIYNLGASVKRITTDTEICPCCKRKIK